LLAEVLPVIRGSVSISRQWRSYLDVEDVIQVSITEVYLRIGQFVGERFEGFQAWFNLIAQNNLRTAIRGLKSAKRPQPSKRIHSFDYAQTSHADVLAAICVATKTPSQRVAEEEARMLLDDALARLPASYATAIRRYYYGGVQGKRLG
jgi:RNA polymerase sigma factor (sigma-70 family)